MSMDDWDGTTEAKSAADAWIRLRRPFLEDELRHVTRADGTRLTYVDARVIQERLDDVVGPQRWKATSIPSVYGLTVRLEIRPERDGQWFSREDVADFGDPTYGRMESAFVNGFRRAAAQFGIARHCYVDNGMQTRPTMTPPSRPREEIPRRRPARFGQGVDITAPKPITTTQTPWNEDKVHDKQGPIPQRPYSAQEKWANFTHGQPGNVRYGWDEHAGFCQTEHGPYRLSELPWSFIAERAVPGDELCDRLVWELENIGFDERYHTRKGLTGAALEKVKNRHTYRVSQTKGVLLYIYARRAAVPAVDELPADMEDAIASTYDDDLPF